MYKNRNLKRVVYEKIVHKQSPEGDDVRRAGDRKHTGHQPGGHVLQASAREVTSPDQSSSYYEERKPGQSVAEPGSIFLIL